MQTAKYHTLSIASLSDLLFSLATTANPFQNDIGQKKRRILHVADTEISKEVLVVNNLYGSARLLPHARMERTDLVLLDSCEF